MPILEFLEFHLLERRNWNSFSWGRNLKGSSYVLFPDIFLISLLFTLALSPFCSPNSHARACPTPFALAPSPWLQHFFYLHGFSSGFCTQNTLTRGVFCDYPIWWCPISTAHFNFLPVTHFLPVICSPITR